MKKIIYLIASVSLILIISSCSKDEDPSQNPSCEHLSTLEINPFCNFVPAAFPDLPIPIAVWYEGSNISEGFTFDWGDGFTGSAKSVTYNQLPAIVLVTEIETGCIIELSLTKEYWE